jgi:hypothetical protein
MSNFTNRLNQLANVGGTAYTGANALSGVDKMLDDRNPEAGVGAGAMDLSNAAAGAVGTPWMMNRLGGRTKGALGLLSLPGTVSGAAQGLTSGDALGMAGGALDGYLAYQGGKEFMKSPLGQRSVSFLNNTAKPAANMAYDAAKPVVSNAIRQAPGAVAGAVRNTYNVAKPTANMAYDAAKPVVSNAIRQAPGAIANAAKHVPVGAAAKFIGKKIPLVGLGIGLGAAGQRAWSGDFTGAGLEALSGVASTFPGVGTVASTAIDAGLMARDYNKSNPASAQSVYPSPKPSPLPPPKPVNQTNTNNNISTTPKIQTNQPSTAAMSSQKTNNTSAPTAMSSQKTNNIPVSPQTNIVQGPEYGNRDYGMPAKPAPIEETSQSWNTLTAKPVTPGANQATASTQEVNPLAAASTAKDLGLSNAGDLMPKTTQSWNINTPAPEVNEPALQSTHDTSGYAPQSQYNTAKNLGLSNADAVAPKANVVTNPAGKTVGVGGVSVIDQLKASGRIPQDFQMTSKMRTGEEALPANVMTARNEFLANQRPKPVAAKPVAMDTKPEQLKISSFRRNTGIIENGEIWVNPADRYEVEKRGGCWDNYISLPAEEKESSLIEFFNRLSR